MISEIELLNAIITAGNEDFSDEIDLTYLSSEYFASLILIITGDGAVNVAQQIKDNAGVFFKPTGSYTTVVHNLSSSINSGSNLFIIRFPTSTAVRFRFKENSGIASITVYAKLFINS